MIKRGDRVICKGVPAPVGLVLRVSPKGKYHGHTGWADVRWQGWVVEFVGSEYFRVFRQWSKRMPLASIAWLI